MFKILVFTLLAVEAMPDAMLAAAVDGHMHGPEATLVGTEREVRRTSMEIVAPGHGHGTNTIHWHGPGDTAPAMKKPRSLAPQPSINEKENIRRANSV